VPRPTAEGVERLVACDKFVLDRHSLVGTHTVGGDDGFHILAVVQGSVLVAGDPAETPLKRGGVVLVPASCGLVELTASEPAVVLDAYLP
jgi:mannose-6-phosphate isomerase